MQKPNQIITHKDYAEIVIHSKGEYLYSKIDIEDIDNVKVFHWCLDPCGYAYARIKSNGRGNQTNIKLHRLLLKDELTEDKPFVDHINRNRLDNRRINLRTCNSSENNRNITRQKNNASGCTGVGWCKIMNKWRSRIYLNGKEIRLGYFDDINEAVKARLEAEEMYLGRKIATDSMDEQLIFQNVRR